MLIDEDVFSDLVISLSPSALSGTLRRAIVEMESGLKDIRLLHSENRHEALRKQVHHMSGSAAILGARRLQQHLAMMETACKKDDAARVGELLKDLDGLVVETTTTLSEFADQ